MEDMPISANVLPGEVHQIIWDMKDNPNYNPRKAKPLQEQRFHASRKLREFSWYPIRRWLAVHGSYEDRMTTLRVCTPWFAVTFRIAFV